MSESDKLDDSFESASAKSAAALRNELGSIPHPRVSTTISEERVSAKGNNKYVFQLFQFYLATM